MKLAGSQTGFTPLKIKYSLFKRIFVFHKLRLPSAKALKSEISANNRVVLEQKRPLSRKRKKGHLISPYFI